MVAVPLLGKWHRDQLRTENGACDPSVRKHVSAAQQKMTPHSGVYSKLFENFYLAGFAKGLACVAKAKSG